MTESKKFINLRKSYIQKKYVYYAAFYSMLSTFCDNTAFSTSEITG